jgi:hypothetical protein
MGVLRTWPSATTRTWRINVSGRPNGERIGDGGTSAKSDSSTIAAGSRISSAGDGALPWRPTTAGVHRIRVVDDHGRPAERDVDVRFIQ